MAKILLVEDDNNLREIYEARLQAEGYEIVSAQDGEAALVVAKKELPDLIISDVMMPRISGFEMLDILRNTEGLKNVKIIMLTALGQAEDKSRANTLGADKYLVKSQVTLEDIVKSAAELLGGASAPAPPPAPATSVAAGGGNPVAPAVPTANIPAPAPTVMFAVPTPTPIPPPPAVTVPTSPPAVAAATSAPVAAIPAPQPQPTPSAATPQPPAAATAAPPADPVAASDEQLVVEAVQDLLSGTPGATAGPAPAVTPAAPPAPPAAAPTPAAPVAPPAATPAPAPVPAPTPPAPPAAPDLVPTSAPTPPPVVPVTPAPPTPTVTPAPVQPPTDDGVTPAKKKIIQPLAAAEAVQTTDLNTLLAKEGHTLDDQGQPIAAAHPPGHVISPTPVNAAGQPVDPNSISL